MANVTRSMAMCWSTHWNFRPVIAQGGDHLPRSSDTRTSVTLGDSLRFFNRILTWSLIPWTEAKAVQLTVRHENVPSETSVAHSRFGASSFHLLIPVCILSTVASYIPEIGGKFVNHLCTLFFKATILWRTNFPVLCNCISSLLSEYSIAAVEDGFWFFFWACYQLMEFQRVVIPSIVFLIFIVILSFDLNVLTIPDPVTTFNFINASDSKPSQQQLHY